MKLKRLIIVVLILLCLLSIGAASADENVTVQDNTTQEIIKTSDYTYQIEIPEGNSTSFGNGMELRDLPKDASGNISMSIDGNEKYNKYVNPNGNRYSIDTKKLAFGNHTAEIKYSGDEKYEGFIKTSSFNYVPVIVDVPEEVEIDNYCANSINIYIADGVTGNIKIVIDGKTYLNHAINSAILEENVDTGEFYITQSLEDLSFGRHTYKITYSKGNQKSFSKSGTFDASYFFNVTNDDNVSYGDSVDFAIELAQFSNLNMTVTFNDKKYSVPLEYGCGSRTLSDFNLGKNNVTFTYEDSYLPLKSVTKTVNVEAKLIAPKTVEYKSHQNITLTVSETSSGTLTAKIGNKTYSSKIINGTAQISLDDLTIGEYEVEITSDFKNASYTLTVTPNFKLPYAIWNGETYNLEFTAPESYNGVLKLTGMINDNVTVSNGRATIPIANFTQGEYHLSASYIENGTEMHSWEFETIITSQSRDWDMQIDFPDELNIYYDDYADIKIKNIPYPVGGYFTLYVDGKIYDTKDIYTVEEYPFYFDDAVIQLGNHTFTLAYSGDGYLHPVNKTKTFEVKKVSINIEENYGRVTVIVPNNDKGTVTVNVDGKKIKSVKITPDDEEFYNRITINLNEIKPQNVEVIYSGKYGMITKQANITPTYSLSVDVEEYYDEDEDEDEERWGFIITPDDLTGTLTVSIDGTLHKTIKCTAGEDYYYFVVPDLKPGVHNINVTYLGDSKYPQKSVNTTFREYSKIKSPYWMHYGEINFVRLTLPEDATGNLSLYIKDDSGKYQLFNTTPMKEGFAKIQLPSSEIGEYDYKATFTGNYDVDDINNTMYVKMNVSYPYEMTWGSDEYITLKCYNVTNGYFVLQTFSDEYYDSVRFNGSEARISLKNLDIGDYSEGYLVTLLYENGKYVDDYELSFYISPVKSKLTGGKNINMYYSDSKTYSLKIWGDYGKVVGAGQVVTIKIGKKTFKVKTDKNGIAKLKIPNTITPGTYKIKATYHGTTVTKTLKVKKVLALKAVKVKKSAKKLILTATLKKGKKAIKNAKVTFKFNGKTYKTKTNKYGIAKVTIKKSVLKKLKVGKKIKYQATYLKVTVKKTAKVKK